MNQVLIYNGNFVSISGSYEDFPDIVSNLGSTLEDYEAGQYVLLSEEQQQFLEDNPEISPIEAWNMEAGVYATDVEKAMLVESIEEYDASSEVNMFYVNDEEVWFSKETRTALNNSLTIEQEIGKETTVLWVNGTPYTLSVATVKQMLVDIELYALACYNNTQTNIAEANGLTLKEEVKGFDVTRGYPEKLRFEFQ